MKHLAVVRLDHARERLPWLRWNLALPAAGACLCAVVAVQAVDLKGRAERLDDRLQQADRMHRTTMRAHAPAQPAPMSVAERRAEDTMRSEMSRPWETLFAALEQAIGPDISLLALTPRGAMESITLDGEARNLAALLAFMRQLRAGGFFTEIHLRDHHVDAADALHPVRFAVQLKWRRP
jgi:Tfp pilus assembly protein PilN